jgi:methyl-accepting chemotaxis protein
MRLERRIVLSISLGIVTVLGLSEVVRQTYDAQRLADFQERNPERVEAAMHATLAPIAESVQSAIEDVMAEGSMELLDRMLVRQQRVTSILDVSLFNAMGKATHGSRADLVGRRLEASIVDGIRHRGRRVERVSGDAFEVYQPFVATEACTRCHADWTKGEVGGVLGLRISKASFLETQKDLLHSTQDLKQSGIVLGTSVSAGLLMVLVLLVQALVRKQIIRPLGVATAFVETISRGDLTKDVDASLLRRADEYGALARAMAAMAERLRTMLRNLASGAQTIGIAAAGLSDIAKQTATGVERVSSKTEAAALAAADASSYAMAIASSIDAAEQGLSAASTATETMSVRVAEVVAHSERAKQTTEHATSKAVSISSSMVSLDEATQSIGHVTETITRISAQTNLLALNATIEAARAGALGKGFAVVAAEIKELAQQTANATQEVKDKIASVQSSTATAMADLDGISAVIQEVGGTVSETAQAMTNQAETSQQVVSQLGQATSGVSDANRSAGSAAEASLAIANDIVEVNDCIGEIRRGGEQVQESAAKLLGLADNLTKVVEEFKLPDA